MKILHLIYTKGISGAEKYLKHILPGLQKNGIEVFLVVATPSNNLDILKLFFDSLKNDNITIEYIASTKLQLIFTANKLNKYIIKHDIQYVHSHLLGGDAISFLIKRFFNKKIITISTKHGYQEKTIKNYLPNQFKITKNLYYYTSKLIFSKINFNIAVSKAISILYKELGLTTKLYDYIYHGIPMPNISEEKNETYRFADTQIIIIGRLEEIKGHKYAIQCFRKVVDVNPTCQLIILGEGSLRENLNELVKELLLISNVKFLGFKSNPYNYINNSDIVLLPSLFEPFGLVYIEALALQKPIIAFDVPAGNELLKNNENAILVTKYDIDSLSNSIIEIIKNKSKGDKLASTGYKIYLQKFTPEVMIKNTIDWYTKNLKNN